MHEEAGIAQGDREALIRDKYAGDRSADLSADLARLSAGEPLAYVIGWIPFMGVRINLDSCPLIPRPETEWWTELLIKRVNERTTAYEGSPTAKVLDLCSGSGAVGAAILRECPNAEVSFGELVEKHIPTIEKNVRENGLDMSRARIRAGDLLKPFPGERFDVIAVNPPYIPEGRELDRSVAAYEPHNALYAGSDGLDVIRRIAKNAPHHLKKGGELWIECDIANIDETAQLLSENGAEFTEIRTDHYGRPRLVVGYYQ